VIVEWFESEREMGVALHLPLCMGDEALRIQNGVVLRVMASGPVLLGLETKKKNCSNSFSNLPYH
jgi:hypothetical protein